MGDWNMTIQGTGVHHNVSLTLPEDADKMFDEFVDKLKSAGHTIVSATFTSGARQSAREVSKP